MLFNSLPFLIFFPIVTMAYYLTPYRWRWVLLLAASCFFYMWFKPIYILILLGTIVIDFTAGRMIDKKRAVGNSRGAKGWLIGSIISTLAVLAVFKYQGLFRETNILLPIGLSFHTFQSLSYVIEVYRGTQKAEHHFGLYSLYVMFYPQLVTGPIERPGNLLRQLHVDQPFRKENLSAGVLMILFGLFVKMVIADNLATYVDLIYDAPADYSSGSIALGMVFYSFQIYCDFFGYSTIALGCAKAMGYDLMDNFRAPYLSTSIGEFWRRWHISLSSWFRDYVYIPMGGSRVRWGRWMMNIMVVFLLSGLWHGASWTFVAWGGLHGVALIVERLGKKLSPRSGVKQKGTLYAISHRLSHVVCVGLVFFIVTLLWTLFRAESFGQWIEVLGSFDSNWVGEHSTLHVDVRVWIFLAIFIVVDILLRNSRIDRWCLQQKGWVQWTVGFALAFCILVFASVENFPFIYFQF